MNNTMGGAKRGLSVVGGALIVGAIAILVIGIIIVGTGGPRGTGEETPDEPTPTPTTVPATSSGDSTDPTFTEITTTPSTTAADPPADIRRFENHFAQRIEARNSDMSVIDVETVENTVYVSVQGPNEGGWAQATNDDLAEAFTDALKVDWSNESVSFGIDHAVVALYDQNGNLFWNVRIEESWAYRYHIENITLDTFTSNLLRSGHSETEPWINRNDFIENLSSFDGVQFISLEQYASTYFLSIETSRISGQEYRSLMFKISEALRSSRRGDKIVYLQYVMYSPDNSQAITNFIDTGWGDFWAEDQLSRDQYIDSITSNTYSANEIPDGIGSMLTRRTPFPADPPPE